jgi:hypothetical protein
MKIDPRAGQPEDGPDLEAMTACKARAGVANLNMTAQALMNGLIEERIA